MYSYLACYSVEFLVTSTAVKVNVISVGACLLRLIHGRADTDIFCLCIPGRQPAIGLAVQVLNATSVTFCTVYSTEVVSPRAVMCTAHASSDQVNLENHLTICRVGTAKIGAPCRLSITVPSLVPGDLSDRRCHVDLAVEQ